MLTKFILGAALFLTVGLSGGVWALANKKADNCCYPGSECCYPGSPCCDDCCYPGSPCCYPGSPCCGDAPKATPADAAAKKVDCCPDQTCCDGGKCCANEGTGN